MIRNAWVLKNLFRVRPVDVMHIGAHHGQDRGEYIKLGANRIIWGEAADESAEYLRSRYPEDVVAEFIFWNKSNLQLDFFESTNEEISSAIPPIISDRFVRKSKESITIDDFLENDPLSSPSLLVRHRND
jgi:hypothetical protein